MEPLLLVCLGTLPKELFHCIYQAARSAPDRAIYVLMTPELIRYTRGVIETFDKSLNVTLVPIKCLNSELLPRWHSVIFDEKLLAFRGAFWKYTIARFFYIHAFAVTFSFDSFWHIENDVMIYDTFGTIPGAATRGVFGCRDSKERVIASAFFANVNDLAEILESLLAKLSLGFSNDMYLLGGQKEIQSLPVNPYDTESATVYDAAGIGQFLDGTDPRNGLPPGPFINETADWKISNEHFYRKNGNFFVVSPSFAEKAIACIHVHSKRLHRFASGVVPRAEIITGNGFARKADIVFTTPQKLRYTGPVDFNPIVVKDPNDVNVTMLNEYVKDAKTIFVYGDLVDTFIEKIFPFIKAENLVFYFHNSDTSFGEKVLHDTFLRDPRVTCVFAQNVSTRHKKARLLPIGIANETFSHGNLDALESAIESSYLFKKKHKNVYINLNTSTFFYRKVLLEKLPINKTEPFGEYLKTLASYRFALCVRGNGIDTHRFWECIYLKVIPVIINNKFTKMAAFVHKLTLAKVPFYEITCDDHEAVRKEIMSLENVPDNVYLSLLADPKVASLSSYKIDIS